MNHEANLTSKWDNVKHGTFLKILKPMISFLFFYSFKIIKKGKRPCSRSFGTLFVTPLWTTITSCSQLRVFWNFVGKPIQVVPGRTPLASNIFHRLKHLNMLRLIVWDPSFHPPFFNNIQLWELCAAIPKPGHPSFLECNLPKAFWGTFIQIYVLSQDYTSSLQGFTLFSPNIP